MSDLGDELAQSLASATGRSVEALAVTLAHLKPGSFANADGNLDANKVAAYAKQLAEAPPSLTMSERRRAVADSFGPRKAVVVDRNKDPRTMSMAERRETARAKAERR